MRKTKEIIYLKKNKFKKIYLLEETPNLIKIGFHQT